MAASTTPPSTEPAGRLPAGRCIAVACSGGRDSIALLHATARMAAELASAHGPIHVLALHVHHGLSPQADTWLAHVQATCDAWAESGLPVSAAWRCVSVPMGDGGSVEASARQARYQALAEMARVAGCTAVLLAHHRRDQAETFLLQALRSAGAAGLSAMPMRADRGGIAWLRPWLSHPREDVEAYVKQHGLAHIEDDSNQDKRFSRNRLRLSVWPALSGAFDGVEARLAQAASHQADLKACLDDWLAQQLPVMTRTVSGRLALDVATWLSRPPGPQRELLRAWFGQATGVPMPMSGVRRLQSDLLRMAERSAPGQGVKGSARWPWPAAGNGSSAEPATQGETPAVLARELVLYRGWLSVRHVSPRIPARVGVKALDPDEADQAIANGASADKHLHAPAAATVLCITEVGDICLPKDMGLLTVSETGQGGVALACLSDCTVRIRQGGEQFQLGPDRPARSLKKQFQSMAVPAWERQGPLLYAGNQLVFVPGLGIDARAWAGQGEPQVQLHWRPTQIGVKSDHTCHQDAKTPPGG